MIGVGAISFAAIFFKKAAPTHPIAAAGIRLLLSAALLAPLALRSVRRGAASRPLVRAGCIAGLMYGVHFGTWVASLTMTSVAASATLVTATPLLLAVWALLTGRDRPKPGLWLSLSLAVVGVVLIGGHDGLHVGRQALIGDGLALTGAAAMAGYLLTGRGLGAAMDVWLFMAIATFVGGVALLGCALATGVPFVAASPEAFLYLLLAALFPQLVGHSLLTWSLQYTTPTVVGIATLGEPVGAALIGWLWLGEVVSPTIALGCSIILCAVVLALRNPSALSSDG